MHNIGDHAATDRALEVIKAALAGGAITLPGLNKKGVAVDAAKFDAEYLGTLISNLAKEIQKSGGQ